MIAFYARTSDNMLDDDDWGCYCFFYDPHKDEVLYAGERMPGVYGPPSIAGYTLKQLLEWLHYDGTGQMVECQHDYRRVGDDCWHDGYKATAETFGVT